jgi:hypothetical protein
MVIKLDWLKEIVNNMSIEYDRLNTLVIGVKTKVTSLKLNKYDLDTVVFWFPLTENSFSWFSNSPCGSGLPHYRGFAITIKLTTLGRTPLEE